MVRYGQLFPHKLINFEAGCTPLAFKLVLHLLNFLFRADVGNDLVADVDLLVLGEG